MENDTIRKISFWCRSSFVVSIIGIFCVVRKSVVNFVVFGKVVVFYESKGTDGCMFLIICLLDDVGKECQLNRQFFREKCT